MAAKDCHDVTTVATDKIRSYVRDAWSTALNAQAKAWEFICTMNYKCADTVDRDMENRQRIRKKCSKKKGEMKKRNLTVSYRNISLKEHIKKKKKNILKMSSPLLQM